MEARREGRKEGGKEGRKEGGLRKREIVMCLLAPLEDSVAH